MQATRTSLLLCIIATSSLYSMVQRPEQKPFVKKINQRVSQLRACPILCDTYSDRTFFYIPETINKDVRCSMWIPSTKKLLALSEKNIITNYGETPEPNPLHTQEISAIHMMSGRPVIACSDYNKLIYFDIYKDDDKKIITSAPLNDAQGNPSQGIVNFAFGTTGNNWRLKDNGKREEENDWEYIQALAIVAAVKGSDCQFGEGSSGLALIKPTTYQEKYKVYDEEDEQEVEKTRDRYKLYAVDATFPTTFKPWLKETEPICQLNKAIPLTKETTAFSYNGGLNRIEPNAIALCFDQIHDRFLIGLSVTTADNATEHQGACALATAYVFNNQLVLNPIMPQEMLTHDAIIGAVGPGKKVSVHHIATLSTSTCLPYIVIVGGQGEFETTSRTIWALPQATVPPKNSNPYASRREAIEMRMTNIIQGTIAAKNSEIISRYDGYGNTLQFRTFTDTITSTSEAPTINDRQFLVGSGELPAAVTRIQVIHDAVVATVNDDTTKTYGVYSSQAIFEPRGSIVAWTPWTRIHASNHRIIAYQLNSENGTGMTALHRLDKHRVELHEHAWVGPENKHEARPENRALVSLMEHFFTKEEAGIQSLSQLHDNQTNSDVLVATGYKKVALVSQPFIDSAQSESNSNEHIFLSTDGTLNGFDPRIHTALALSGGILGKLGPIVTAAIGTDGSQSWLFVGGAFGIARLCRADGSGCIATSSEKNFFEGLDASMSFASISDLQFVKKIVAHETKLYALTYQTVQMHHLDEGARTTSLATALECGVGAFTDCCVSDGYFLLGTTNGLFSKLRDETLCKKYDELFDNKAITRIIQGQTATVSGMTHQNIYVLTGSHTQKDAHVFRLYSCHTNTLSALKPLEDFGKPDHIKGVMSCRQTRTLFATDGAMTITAHSGNKSSQAAFHILTPSWAAGNQSKGFAEVQAPAAVPADAEICSVMRTTIGGWIVAGNFGLHVLEA